MCGDVNLFLHKDPDNDSDVEKDDLNLYNKNN